MLAPPIWRISLEVESVRLCAVTLPKVKYELSPLIEAVPALVIAIALPAATRALVTNESIEPEFELVPLGVPAVPNILFALSKVIVPPLDFSVVVP